jgi:hypothetical protein
VVPAGNVFILLGFAYGVFSSAVTVHEILISFIFIAEVRIFTCCPPCKPTITVDDFRVLVVTITLSALGHICPFIAPVSRNFGVRDYNVVAAVAFYPTEQRFEDFSFR